MSEVGRIKFEIVTPDRVVLSDNVDYVSIPGADGEFGVLPRHINLLAALGTGVLYYKHGSTKKYAFVSGGFAEVTPESVAILAEAAESAETIDVARAERAKHRAERRVQGEKLDADQIDHVRAQAALHRAIIRLRIASGR